MRNAKSLTASQKAGKSLSVHGSIPFDRLRIGLTTNGISNTYGLGKAFALGYRRVNAAFYEFIVTGSLSFMNSGGSDFTGS